MDKSSRGIEANGVFNSFLKGGEYGKGRGDH
jgi:hypothetical protein